MDFGFGEDQELLRSTTRRFLTEHQSLAHLRPSLEEPDLFDAAVWRQGAELGWTAMLIPAEYDGGSVSEQPLVDLIVLAEELGRELNPGPFVPTNVVADAIARHGSEVQAKEHLPRIARGESTCAWCLSGDGAPEPSAVEVRATRVGDGWRLDGVARYVHAAGDATLLLVTAKDTKGDGVVNLLVPRPTTGLSERVLSGLDLTRRFAEVRFDAAPAPGTAELAGGWPVVERCLSVATVLQAAESVGAADLVFASTVD
jgi:alkylation response protein AidB-like acyl-CoA dehydrogenase